MGKVQVEADIPQTVNYVATSVNVGTTTTLNPGQQATVTNSGTEQNAIFNFGIPRGKSAYEEAVEGGYEGTETEFKEALASDIATVADNISDVNAVGQAITDINTVADNLTDISAVSTIASDVSTVSGISSDVTNVSSISNAITSVNNNETAIQNVSDNLANVNTVAANMNSVLATAGDITNIDAVANNKTNIDTVAGVSSAVSTVASIASDVTAVKNNATDISTVASNVIDVNTVSDNISDVNSAATNMSAIIAAPTEAANAATSASNAQKWAEGLDSDVSPLGGTHSSKGWAAVCQQLVESIGSVLHYKGSVASYANLPTTGQELGDMWNVTDTGANYVWTGSAWDAISGIVDLSAYRTSAAQDAIDATKANDNAVVHTTGDESIAGVKTFTTKITSPIIETGTAANNYFQSRKFRGEGDANTYYHAVDFGYQNHDQVDFYEYGGKYVFHKHTAAAIGSGDTVLGEINSNGWEGNVKGNVTGNADTATKATQDGSGNTITATYATKSENNTKVEYAMVIREW